jgi:hypothetical protein
MAIHNTPEENDSVFVECRRGCDFKYDFKLENLEIVTVICGEPEAGVQYKAVSFYGKMYLVAYTQGVERFPE